MVVLCVFLVKLVKLLEVNWGEVVNVFSVVMLCSNLCFMDVVRVWDVLIRLVLMVVCWCVVLLMVCIMVSVNSGRIMLMMRVSR